jgi:protocatechuate 3,4-dioxygenase beta subunit
MRMVSAFDLAETVPEWALAYRWDIVLRGRDETRIETAEEHG